jgi:hypothetical protein
MDRVTGKIAMAAYNPRTRLYTLLQVGKTELQWDEDFYRQMLQEHGAKIKGGKYSASTMKIWELEALLDHMKHCGFKVKRNPDKLATDIAKRKEAMVGKVSAIWCCLHDHQIVHNRSDAAMEKFVGRFSGGKPLRWATAGDLSNAIEALKKMAQRAGVDLAQIESDGRRG